MKPSVYLELTKPRVTAMGLLTTLVGFVMGAGRATDWRLLPTALLGAWLVGSGANALNQWAEWDRDALMERTKHRPLPSGRLAPHRALAFGLILSIAGLACLCRWATPSAAGWGAALLLSYVGVYTPLKRTTTLCTLVGAVPGAMPPMIGWAAARGAFGVEAWVVFAILFLWQLPHFLAIAWIYQRDYANAGFRMWPVVDPAGHVTARQLVLYGAALLPISLLPTTLGVTGRVYFVGVAALGAWFVGAAVLAARHRSFAVAHRLFLASVGYLPLVLLLMVLDKAIL